MDAFVISVDNMEESFVFDGGMEGSDASLDVDDGRGETVKDPGGRDVKEAELVIDIVGIAGPRDQVNKVGGGKCLKIAEHVVTISPGVKASAPMADLTCGGVSQIVGGTDLVVYLGMGNSDVVAKHKVVDTL